MTKKTASSANVLTQTEIGFAIQALCLAPLPFRQATQSIIAKYRLKGRSPWFLMLLHNGLVAHPSDFLDYFDIGASLISDELRRLRKGGFVAKCADPGDLRRHRLTLTPLGSKVAEQVQASLTKVVLTRFSHQSHENMLNLICTLEEFVFVQRKGDGNIRRAHDLKKRATLSQNRNGGDG